MDKIIKIFDWYNQLASFLYLSMICGIIYFAWGYGDDYFILNRIQSKSIIESMIYFYNYWDGRQLSPGGLIHFLNFKYLSINFGIALIFFSWIFFLIFSLRVLDFQYSLKHLIIIISLFFIGLFPFYKDILFWKTGGFYVFFLIQAVTIIWLYKENKIENRFIEFFIILLLSLNSINIIFPLFIYFIFLIFEKLIFQNKKIDFRQAYFSIAIFVGIIIVTISPGNSVRMESEGIVFLSFRDSISNFPSIVFKALNYSKYSFILGVMASWLVVWNKKYSIKQLFGLGIFFFIISIFSVFPFFFTPSLARVRVFFSMATILFFSGCFLGLGLNQILNFFVKKIFISIGLSIGLIILFIQFLLIVPHSKLIESREMFLIRNYQSNRDVIYTKIIKPSNLLIIRSPDYNLEWNSDLVEYYKLNSYTEK